MNDDLEQRLAAMRPIDLQADLHARLAASEPVGRKKVRWLFVAAPLAAAAVWLLVLALHHPGRPSVEPKVAQAPQPSDFRVFLPVEETSTLVEAKDIAFIDTDPARPVQLVRATWIDDIIYRGDDGRTLRRQESRIEFIPIVMNAF